MKEDVALISGAPGFSNQIAMKNLVEIQNKFHSNIHILRLDFDENFIKNDNIHFHKLFRPWGPGENIFLRFIGIMILQIHTLSLFIKLSKEVKYFFFLQSTQLFFLGLIFLKFKGINIIKITTRDYTQRKLGWILELVYAISDLIVVYTESMIDRLKIKKESKRIVIWNYNFVNNSFRKVNRVDEREYIGYIGRLAPEKNIDNLITGAKKLDLKNKLIIVGGGQSFDEIKNLCEREGVKFVGKLPHKEVPKHMNELKILILPSKNEGFPKIITEAMACGTIVLSTDVGGISDVIKDGENGFLIPSPSAKSIVGGLKRILNRDDLELISEIAVETINTKFSYNRAVNGYKKLLRKLDSR